MKFCAGCHQNLPVSAFAKRTKSKDGLQYRCKACNNRTLRTWRKDNPEAAKRITFRGILKRYGLTEESYEALLQSQGGKCAICHFNPPRVIDHDHETNQVRGLLCDPCNLGLGLLGDRIEFIESALEYLRSSRSR